MIDVPVTAAVAHTRHASLIRVPNALRGLVVWRGWAQDSIDGVIDNQESLKKEVMKAVTRMMALFPRHL